MSCSYADGLSDYEHKGKLGLKENFESEEEVKAKVKQLAQWIQDAKHVVVHTGAGVSTSAGIPDFRGPKGVWTLEAKGEKPDMNVSFDDAVPTATHMALISLINAGKIHYIISQNIDGLHLRSGLPREYLSELHGNMFIEQCDKCNRQFVRKKATTSVGQKCLDVPCRSGASSRPCRGKLHDTILDWEHDLPGKDLELADYHSYIADLSICLGTTLQIVPSGNLPTYTKKFQDGKLVICNLQPTKQDKKADLIINTYVDDIMLQLLQELGVEQTPFTPEMDPTNSEGVVEWTINNSAVQKVKQLYKKKCASAKKRLSQKGTPKAKKLKKEIKEEPNSPIKNGSKLIEIKQESDFGNGIISPLKIKEEIPDIEVKKESNESNSDNQNDSETKKEIQAILKNQEINDKSNIETAKTSNPLISLESKSIEQGSIAIVSEA